MQGSKQYLNDTALNMTLLKLREYGNEPSSIIKEALSDIILTMTDMALGEAEPKYYVSPIDPGLGKTTAIIQWLKVFLTVPKFKNVGVLVCLDRHDQIASFIHEGHFHYSLLIKISLH